MLETLEEARKELIRVDHLVYVSLKYTRTVDMIKHAIKRIISSYDFLNEALLLYSKENKKILEIPSTPVSKRETLMDLFKEDEFIIKNVMLHTWLRKVDKIEKSQASREFRKHVTMTLEVEGKEVKVDIEKIYEYYNLLQEYNDYVNKMIIGEKEEE
ncbi:MAG: hypothetical protein QF362_04020 [Candidatus Woesearchaeota archaeon]|jgi:hypothetical protein|nr:hypothetical protein [Candidatus Woesearchaeota archaeon]MDP7506582.1 hypothetical protein [Candidatus Woesearchaeota archaeon]MDP7610237.1 hypothetical protein [Candidatus Woesearchaeota archaeon]